MKTKIYRIIDKQVIKDWQMLWEKSPDATYTNSPQWFLTAVDTFSFKDYAIIALYEKEKIIAVGALVKEKKYGLNFYTVAPSNFVCGVPFLLDLKNHELVQEFRKQLLSLGSIFLSNIPAEFLKSLRGNSSIMESSFQTFNYFLPIVKDNNGQALIGRRSKLTHGIKGIQEKVVLRSFDGKMMEGLNKAFDIDDQSVKQSRGYNTFDSPIIKKFYKNIAKYFQEYFLINVLYIENTPIAYEMGFLIGQNYFGSQMAYVTEYKQYSPGKVILVKLIDFLATENVKKLDFGSGDSLIKRLLTEEKKELYEVVLSSNMFVRVYSKYTGLLKNFIFDQLHHHVRIYATYRKLKKILHL